MLSLLAPILVFGLVIFIHEFGHFLAAKATGVYAPRFSIGFGPSLFKFRRGETEYVLAILPLGGYVRMASRLDEQSAFLEGGSETQAKEQPEDWDPEAMVPFGPKPVPENRWFESKPLLARLFIMIAGVSMNILLAIVIISVVAYRVGHDIVPTTVVGSVLPVPTVPALSQLRAGDTIRAIDGKAVASWNDVQQGIIAGHGTTISFLTQRGAVTVPVANDSDRISVIKSVGYVIPTVIDSVVTGERAAAAGLRRGDSITAIDGQPVRVWTDLTSKVNASAEKPLKFVVVRGATTDTLTITPKATVLKSASGQDSTVGKIGAAARDVTRHEPIGLGRAAFIGTRETWNMATTVVGFLKALFVGQVSLRQLGGPIAITRASVTAARGGIEELFYLIALLSVNVAVLNLLPIPILDGGQILINVIESAKGSPFSMKTREYILRFGLAAIALLFIVVMFNDTRGGFTKLFGWLFK